MARDRSRAGRHGSGDRRARAQGRAPPVSLRVFQPTGLKAAAPALLWIHGGGLIFGAPEQAATTAIVTACRLLRLPSIRNEIADRAAKDQMTYRGFLAELLMTECDDRARRRSERRIKAAGFPRDKSLRTFDFDANSNIDPAVINTLASCEWIKKSQPLCLIGDSDTGKSHMLIALGTEAAMQGYRVRYTLATKW